jgi:hypothetical protein
MCFSLGPCKLLIREFSDVQNYSKSRELENGVSRHQPAGIRGIEMSRVFGIGSCRIVARKELDYEKETACVI